MKKEASPVSYVIKLTVILCAISAVVALLLGAVNSITEEKIAAINVEKTAEAIQKVLPSEAEPEAIADFVDETGLVTNVYKMGDDGYAVELIVGGSQGDITMMVGVDANEAVSGISFIKMSETPGLGAIASQDGAKGEAFRSQFVGKSGSVAVTKDGGDIDSLTGATVTSRAVATGVNAALSCVANFS